MSVENLKMSKVPQFNFNSFVGIVCTAMVGWAVIKLDTMNTAIIQQQASLSILKDHISEIDTAIKTMVTQGQFSAAMSQRDREIESLKKAIDSLRPKPGVSHNP